MITKDLWTENLLRSGDKLADDYIKFTLVDEDFYFYLDK